MTDNYLPELIVDTNASHSNPSMTEDDEETELPVKAGPLDDKIAYDIAYTNDKEESEEEEEKEEKTAIAEQKKEILKVETIFKPLKIKPVVDDTLTRPSEKEEEINLNEEDFKPQQEMLGEPKKKKKNVGKTIRSTCSWQKNQYGKTKSKSKY